MKRIIGWAAILSVVLLASVLPLLHSAPVNPATQALETMLTPPGHPDTTQTAFCQTATAGATVNTITVPALAGKNIYVTGFEITGDGATAQSVIAITLAFNSVTVANYSYNVVAGATTANPSLMVEFTTPVTAGPTGTSCVLTVPSFGAGNTAASVTIHGFYQ